MCQFTIAALLLGLLYIFYQLLFVFKKKKNTSVNSIFMCIFQIITVGIFISE